MPPAAFPVTPSLRGANGAIFAILLFVDSLHFVWARALLPVLDPLLSSTLVLGIATVQIGIYGLWRRQISLTALRRHFWFLTAVGFLVGASTALSYSAIAYIDTGTAAMLGKSTTLFTIALGILWLREHLRPIQIIGALLALAGAVILTFQPGDLLRLGSIMILISSLMYALHAALVKRHGDQLGFMDFFFYRLLFTTLTLGIIALTRPIHFPTDAGAYLLILVAGTTDVVISRTLYYLSLRRFPMSLHAIVLTLSPVITVGWSYFLFDTWPSGQQLSGGLAVILGVTLAAYFRGQTVPASTTPATRATHT